MVLVSQAPLKSKPSFVSVFGLPSGVELFVELRTPPSAPPILAPVLLGPFPRRAGPTAPLAGWLDISEGPFPLHPKSENRRTLHPTPQRLCLLPKHCLGLGTCLLLPWCHLEADACQGLVSFLWGREAPSS